MLLDDVMSELDAERRELLAEELSRGRPERDRHDRPRRTCPAPADAAVARLAISPGASCRRRWRREQGEERRQARAAAAGRRAERAHRRRSRRPRPLARVQEVWGEAAGPAIAAAARPIAERDGVLTVTCEAAVWAQELELMAASSCQRLNARLGAEAVRELRCRTG